MRIAHMHTRTRNTFVIYTKVDWNIMGIRRARPRSYSRWRTAQMSLRNFVVVMPTGPPQRLSVAPPRRETHNERSRYMLVCVSVCVWVLKDRLKMSVRFSGVLCAWVCCDFLSCVWTSRRQEERRVKKGGTCLCLCVGFVLYVIPVFWQLCVWVYRNCM